MTFLEGFLLSLQIVIILYSATLVTSEDAPDFKDPVDDPCSNSYEINSEKRHVTEGSGSGTMCDNTWPKELAWYKFVSRGQPTTIPTTCLKPLSCGSQVALRVELVQALPNEGESTPAWSCGAYDVLGKYDCCVMRQEIIIKNCSNFLAYQLYRPDRCSAAFCVQDAATPLPSSLLIKTGEDVNPVSTLPPVTSPASDNFSALTNKRCIEGQVLCSRFPEPRCSSLEACHALPVPTTIDTTSGDVLSTTDPRAPTSSSTSLPSGDPSTTPSSDDTSTSPSSGDTGTSLPPSDSTSDVMTNPPDTETESEGHITTEAPHETTVVRKFYPETGSYTSTSASTAVVTVVASSTGTASPSAPGVGVSEGEDSTRSTSTASVLDTETSSSSNSLVSDRVHSTNITSPRETSSEEVSGTTVAMTTASVSMTTRAGSSGHFDVSSESPDVLTSGQPSSKTNTSTTVTTTTVIGSTDLSSTVMSSQASSADLQTTPTLGGTIVMEFGKSKGISDVISQLETNLLSVLNAHLERDHEFNSRDVHKTGTVDHDRTIGVLFKVSKANLSADEMVRMLRLLKKNGQLKARDRFGADVIHIYKYGERPDKVSTSPTDPTITKPVDTPTSKATPIDTTTDKTKDTPKTTNSSSDDTPTSAESSYSLFYDKLPLFIAIIVMTTGCVLICLFGLVYLRFYRHQRSWDTQKDMERARLNEQREKEGLDNPLPVSEMVKDEHGTSETTLALNGSHPLPADSHPPPSLCTEDEKGWIVPIDQAPPQSNFEVALRTEDTKL